MFDDDHRIAVVAQPVQHLKQLGDVVEVQPGGGLVENVQRLAGVALGQLPGQLHPLRLAAGKSGRALPQLDVGQADIDQGLQLAGQHGHGVEERPSLLHGHVQHLVDVLALVANVQRLPVVALALALVAGDVDVGQEVHFHLEYPVALAGFAAPALDVEAEAARLVAAGAGLLGLCKQLPDRREQAGVGGGVGAGGAAYGALVDVNHLVQMLQALHALVPRRG